jgi:hypothetical protein
MKLYTTFLLAILAGVLAYAARRRLKVAFTVAAVAYMVLLPARLLLAAGSLGDRTDDVLYLAVGMVVLWIVLSRVSIWYARRRAAKGNPPAQRRNLR